MHRIRTDSHLDLIGKLIWKSEEKNRIECLDEKKKRSKPSTQCAYFSWIVRLHIQCGVIVLLRVHLLSIRHCRRTRISRRTTETPLTQIARGGQCTVKFVGLIRDSRKNKTLEILALHQYWNHIARFNARRQSGEGGQKKCG